MLAASALVVSGFAMVGHADLEQRIDLAEAASAGLEADLADALRAGERASQLLADARETSSTYALILARRAEFVAAVDEAEGVLARASGKVDTSADRERVLELQREVAQEREDAAAVEQAVGDVEGVVADVTRKVDAYDEALRLAASAGGRALAATDTSAPGYGRVRAALDRVGGVGVPLQQYGGACAGITAAACAAPTGVIYFSAEVASWSDARLHWVMAHELAHIRQFRIWGTLVSSAGYASLFGGDIELLANCMAQQRGYPSGNVWCSESQLSWSASIWQGVVPGRTS